MSNLIGKLLEAIGYDREGVQNEVNEAAIFNQKFKKSLIPIGGGRFFEPKSEQLFEISDDGKRITRVLTPKEESEINRTLPRA